MRLWTVRCPSLCLAALLMLAPWEEGPSPLGLGLRGMTVVEGQALQCVNLPNGCGCRFDDGSVIDVTSLGGSGGVPTFKDAMGEDLYKYSYDPCQPFDQGSCKSTAVCQVSADGQATYAAGDASSASWSYDGTKATVFYESDTDTYRQSFVDFICDQSQSTPTLRALGEPNGDATYQFEVRSKCACIGACSGGGGGDDDGGLSGGSIILIVALVLVIVYFGVGITFNRVQRQKSGAEVVPNSGFWCALPGLVREGCVFTFGKIRGGVSRKTGYDEV